MASERTMDGTQTTGLFDRPYALGTMTFGTRVGIEQARAMLTTFRVAGGTHIDTANLYGNGAAEEILGEILAGSRDEVTIASKVGMPLPDRPDESGLSPQAIRSALTSSLRRLRTDYLDLYYLHKPDRAIPIAESLGALRDAVDEGKVRHVGLSNHSAWRFTEARHVAADVGLTAVPAVSQIPYSMIARSADEEYSDFADHTPVETVVYNPLAGGLLTGKYASVDAEPGSGRFVDMPFYRDRYWHARTFEALNYFRDVASQSSLSMAEAALRWVITQPMVTAVLLGATSVQQLAANIAAVDRGPLPEDIRAGCDNVWLIIRGDFPRYCR